MSYIIYPMSDKQTIDKPINRSILLLHEQNNLANSEYDN